MLVGCTPGHKERVAQIIIRWAKGRNPILKGKLGEQLLASCSEPERAPQ